jgi:multiple sugar transport system permease protein
MKLSFGKSIQSWLYGSAVAVLCAWVLFPIFLVGLGAFGGRPAVYQWPKTLWPASLSFNQLAVFLKIDGVWNAALNSVLAASLTMVLAIALGAPAGYALARFNFRGATVFRLMILLTRAFPLAILALPLTVLFIKTGLYDTAFGVSLVHTALALPFAAMITASLFAGIPRELEEVAWVFGCSRWQAFVKVVLPLALPGMAAAAIFAFVISWNEVFAASVLTVQQRTLTAYLLTVLSESPLHYRFAGGFILIVPSVVFIFAVRRYLFALWGVTSR